MQEIEEPLFTITKADIAALPLESFGGKIHVLNSHQGIAKKLDSLLNQKVIGFDTETKPSFVKGVKYNISLLQLASKDEVWLFRLNHLKTLPSEIKSLLESESILKIAQDPGHDLRELFHQQGIRSAGFVDIHKIARMPLRCNPRSLAALAAIFLKFRISKSAQRSNWENPVLTPKQIHYAATDAWVSLQVYRYWKKNRMLPPQIETLKYTHTVQKPPSRKHKIKSKEIHHELSNGYA